MASPARRRTLAAVGGTTFETIDSGQRTSLDEPGGGTLAGATACVSQHKSDFIIYTFLCPISAAVLCQCVRASLGVAYTSHLTLQSDFKGEESTFLMGASGATDRFKPPSQTREQSCEEMKTEG